MLKLEYTPYTLDFKFEAKTSRGVMKERNGWFLKITNENGISGIGEVAPIDRLSPEDPDDIPSELEKIKQRISEIFL